MSSALELLALPGIPMVREGDDLAGLIIGALDRRELRDGDVIVVAQKIVSKAEGRMVDLRTVTPSARAVTLAKATEKDPRIVELILAESTDVLRHRPGALIVAHRLGMVLANAAAALWAAEAVPHLRAGVEKAEESIRSGAAKAVLDRLTAG